MLIQPVLVKVGNEPRHIEALPLVSLHVYSHCPVYIPVLALFTFCGV
jgi:hypothetical protein